MHYVIIKSFRKLLKGCLSLAVLLYFAAAGMFEVPNKDGANVAMFSLWKL